MTAQRRNRNMQRKLILKRLVLVVIILFTTTLMLSGCYRSEQDGSDKISIISTIFPQYDWTRQIIGEENLDRFDLTLLIDSRIDLHSYNPSVQDIARIKTCDVFIYVGGDSDSWVENLLIDANPDMITLNLIDILGNLVKYDDHDHDECEEEHEHGEHHVDEHVWLSLRHAARICAAIADALAEVDPANAQVYRNNLESYAAKLSDLDAGYQAVVDAANVTALVFADRFPFIYLMDDYGLEHYAAFQGCSAETEASFITIISLANRLDQIGLDVVMVTESSNQSIARTVIRETKGKNQRILVLDSMQSVNSTDVKSSVTYLSIMESNLAVLKEALKVKE